MAGVIKLKKHGLRQMLRKAGRRLSISDVRGLNRQSILLLCLGVFALLLSACSTNKNTSQSRFWQSFTAKYNTYYNGSLAYIDGCLDKEKGNTDDYTEVIPLYTVTNKSSRTTGGGNFDRAIEKCEKAIKQHSIKKRPEWKKGRKKTDKDKEWLSRREYNPFIWKAWYMMGRSQFLKGEFEQAASTFAYMNRMYDTQPKINGFAKSWLARCYAENDWFYEAEDVLRDLQRDTITPRVRKEMIGTTADLLLHQKRYEEALPYLKKIVKWEKRRKQKAREWFLIAQIESRLGNKKDAYKAYSHVVRLNPPYQLAFNARIAQTEVMASSNAKGTISKLKRMARNENNKDYQDQIYYAIGNVYMLQADTVKALEAYEKGVEKATRSGTEKGVLLTRLGGIYWDMEKYADAQRCYGQAIGMLDKEREGYEEIDNRSKVLDELVPHTESVHLQDSLQALAKMDSVEIIKVIDNVIKELIKKEKEEKKKQQEAEAEQQLAKQNAMGSNNKNAKQTEVSTATTGNGQWYFYNPQAIMQGKAQFQKLWGKRENADDWQRYNKTVVANINDEGDNEDTEATDSLALTDSLQAGGGAPVDSLAAAQQSLTDSLAQDPHNREYYWAQIPFTEEQILESNMLIKDGLYNSGVIFKDKLDNLKLSEKALRRLETQYDDYEGMDNVYYHLFLLYSRLGERDTAATYVTKLQEKYPESQWTLLLSDPNYEENQKFGEHIEDSLYAATYDAFKADRFDEVIANASISETRFPLGLNRAKFIFIDGMRKLNQGDTDGCLENMKDIVANHSSSEVAEMAGTIVNGVKEGRSLMGGSFDALSIWERRTIITQETDSAETRAALSTERNTDFVFMLAFPEDSINANQLLYDLAKHNFTNYLVRNFDIEVAYEYGIGRMMVRGFQNFDEAWQYSHQLVNSADMSNKISGTKVVIISEENMNLLGKNFSFKDYEEFYQQNFGPLIQQAHERFGSEKLLQQPTQDMMPTATEEDADTEEEEEKQQQDDAAESWEDWF